MLSKFLRAVLNQAHSSGFSSLATPAIGTGNLRIPPTSAAQWMFSEVEEFSRNHPRTPLRDIRFVLYSRDTPTVTVSDSLTSLNKVPMSAIGFKQSFILGRNCHFLWFANLEICYLPPVLGSLTHAWKPCIVRKEFKKCLIQRHSSKILEYLCWNFHSSLSKNVPT